MRLSIKSILIVLFSLFGSLGFSEVKSSSFSCDLDTDRLESLSAHPDFIDFKSKIQSICEQETASLNNDEKFFMTKWGLKICKNLMGAEHQFQLQCRYGNLVLNGDLNLAQAFALLGYTQEYYNYLTPEAIAKVSSDSGYEGLDIYNRVLTSAITELNSLPEYQYNGESYRGTKIHVGDDFEKDSIITLKRWTSSSCVQEIAFGPKVVDLTVKEKETLISKLSVEWEISPDEVLETPGIEYELVKRDPKFIEPTKTQCQKDYFAENPRPPLTSDSNFGSGNLSIIYLPPQANKSKRVVIYKLSDRRSEAEVLFPIGTSFKVIEVIPPDKTEDKKTHVKLQEIVDFS